MRTILTRIFSTFLVGATALSVSAAPQVMEKVKSGSRASVSVVAQPEAKTGSLVGTAMFRTGNSTNPFRSAATGAVALPKKVNAPQGAAGQAPNNMYGAVVFSEILTTKGLYTVPTSVNGTFDLKISGVNAQYGGVLVEDTYYCSYLVDFMGIMQFFYMDGYNFETGEKVFSYTSDTPDIFAPGGYAYDATTGNTYGITYNATGNGYQFAKLAFGDNTVTVTPIAALGESFNALAAAADGTIYGIAFTPGVSSKLVKFDKTNGTYTTVGETGVAPKYLSSAAIDHKTGRMYWNVCDANETGFMYEVDLATGVATSLYQLPGNEEIMGLTIPAPEADDKAPAAVNNLKINFAKGALTGTVTFDCPTTLFDGSRTFGDLTYTVLCDGETVANGETAVGATVAANITVATAGEKSFVVYVTNKKGDSPKTKMKVFVGNGIPAAPKVTATWNNGVATLNWAAVTTSADGGYVNPAEVTYTVTQYPEGKVLASGLGTNIFSAVLPMPEQQTVYTYGVTATYAGATSAEGVSNAIILGDIVPPYSETFDSADALAAWTIIDGNADSRKWGYYSGAVRVQYNTSKAMDDYLISPAIKLKAGQACLVSIDLKAHSTTYPEQFEILYGTAPTAAAMTNVLVEPTTIATTAYQTYSAYMVAETDGLYYVGVHGISEKNMYYLYVDNFTLGGVINAGVPAAIEDLTVIPGANGALNATVEFTTPTLNMAGSALEEITKMEVLRGDDVVLLLNGAVEPGKKYTVSDNKIPATGDYTYTVKLYNKYGMGEVTSVQAYIGINYPAAPQNVELIETEDNFGEVSVVWDAITKTEDGQALAASDVTYEIYDYDGESFVEVVKGLTKNYYTWEAVAAGQQDFKQYAVFGVTERGRGDGAVTDFVPVGTPYKNYNETFTNGTLSYIMGIGPNPDATASASWSIYTDASFADITSVDGDNGYIGSTANNLDNGGLLFTGKISLEGLEKPAFTFYTYNIAGDDINTVAVYLSENCNSVFNTVLLPATPIADMSDEEGWVKVTIDLAAYKGQTIQLAIGTLVKQYKYTLLDAFKVAEMLDYDLVATKIEAPANVATSTPFNVNVTVANEGALEATDYTVELYADDKKVAEKAGEALASGAKAVVTFEQEFNDAQVDGVVYMAKVVYAADLATENNSTEEILVAPKVSKLPAPTDLKAEKAGNGVKLTWTEPNLTYSPVVTEDFEDATAFAQEYGDWTFVDVDNSEVGGFQDSNIPGITPGTSKVAFFVFDAADQGVVGDYAESFKAHSGSKYLAGMFRYDDGQVDDWMISPALDGSAQTISFYAKSYSMDYPDAFEVWYSTGSLDPKDFTKVVDKTTAPKDWTEFTANLPEGAKHFAIRSCATSSFMIMIDDVTYTPEGAGELTLVGYDVYRDGVKINTATVEETTFTDAEGVDGSVYSVVAIFANGKSAPAIVTYKDYSGLDELEAGVTITTAAGTINVAGAEGLMVSVVAVDGKLLYNAEGDATVKVLPGVYVVKAGEKVVKVLVK